MSDTDSLYGPGSPSPDLPNAGPHAGEDGIADTGSPAPLSDEANDANPLEDEDADDSEEQRTRVDKGKGRAVDTGSPPPEPHVESENETPEPENGGHQAARPSETAEGPGNAIGDEDSPSLPPTHSPEEENRGGTARRVSDIIDDRPFALDEDGYPIVDPDPDIEVFAVTADEERAEEARQNEAENQATDGYIPAADPSVVVAPAAAFSPVNATAVVPSPSPVPEDGAGAEDDILNAPEPEVEAEVEAERPTTGIERPVQKVGSPKTFTIVRLIENTDKTGNNIASAIQVRRHYFDIDFGDFLLDMSGERAEVAQVRNYAGQERYIPRRMLQDVYQPWDIPAKTRITDDGVPLPLMSVREDTSAEQAGGNVAFEEQEPVMIMDELDGEDDQRVTVTDYERKAGSFTLNELEKRFETPWGILVDQDALMAAWGKKTAPKLPKGKSPGKGTKRKRGENGEDGEDGEDGDEDEDGGDDDVGDDNAGEGPSKKIKTKMATPKKATKVVVKKATKSKVINDDESSNKAITPTVTKAIKEPAGKKPASKRNATKSKADVPVADEGEIPTEVTKGKRKTPAGKTATRKGSKQVKKPAGNKKKTEVQAGSLLEELAWEVAQ